MTSQTRETFSDLALPRDSRGDPPVVVQVSGEAALFSRPELKVERVSYPVMTPPAAVGVLESIFWKPEMRYQIVAIEVLRPIRQFSVRRNETTDVAALSDAIRGIRRVDTVAHRDQRNAVCLRDVAYRIHAHIHVRAHAGRPPAAYRDQFRRRVSRGACFQQPFLGTREFSADFGDSDGTPRLTDLNEEIGIMLHSIHRDSDGRSRMHWFAASVKQGLLQVPEHGMELALPTSGGPLMLLQRLVEYADATADEDDVPQFYQRKPVRWLLDIAADGTLRGKPTDLADADHKFGSRRPVPAITRTVGVAPTLAVDNAEYVFGWTFEGSNPARLPKQAAAFRQLIDEWAVADPAGPGAAIAAFYRDGHHLAVKRDDFPSWGRGDLVAFRVDQVWASSSPSAAAYWAQVAGDRKGSGNSGLCLVCQRVQPLLKTIPQQIPRRLLPGAKQSASLVSVNEAVHGYELQKFLGHTPICADCALKFMGALERLLSNQQHSMALPGQNARLIWWVTGGSAFDPMGVLDQPDPAHIRDLIASPIDASAPGVDDLSRYCSVTLGGNVARVVVRDWIEMPVAQVKANLLRWYNDHEIIDAWTGETTPVSLVQLARATGRWQGNRGRAGEWVKFGGSGEDRPAGVFHALLRTALLGRPLPPGLLAHLLHRIRTDGRIDTARAALIRLALRRPPHRREALMPTIDMNNPDAAYHCGRAFAILDELQRDVRVAKQNLNTSFAQRYLGRAIINPRAALVSGERTSQAWLRRLSGPLHRPSWATAYQQRLDEAYSQIAQRGGFPAQALLVQQGNFILGYHQQRADMRTERTAAQAKKNSDGPQTSEPHTDDDPQGDLA